MTLARAGSAAQPALLRHVRALLGRLRKAQGGARRWRIIVAFFNGLVDGTILTGNHGFSHKIWGFPVIFPSNQSLEFWRLHGLT